MIDQTTLGHQYILTEFGAAANPTIGWQIDPFGHSATQAALLSAEVGFDALFFGRIDCQHSSTLRHCLTSTPFDGCHPAVILTDLLVAVVSC